MMQEVVRFFDENPNLEKADNSILKTHVNKLKDFISQIEANAIKQEFDNTGYTQNKKKAKQELANADVNVTASICSYASDTGKNELYNEFNIPISKVNRMSDADLVNYTKTIVATATENIKDLKPYNVTADELTNLTKQNEAYSQLLLIPAEQRKEKKVATENIKKLISEALKLLKRSIDNDMVHYKDIEPDLYAKYINIREIDDSQTTALSIKGKVTDADTGKPLQYVRVTAKFKAGQDWKDLHATSTAKGNFQFKGIPDGKCTVTFELEYYNSLSVDTAVHSGKATELNVSIKKTEI
jgi:hypothetical protein